MLDPTFWSLRQRPKDVPAVWLYDERGSRLFDEITRLPEYYPTRRERANLATHAGEIAERTGARALVELGSGTSEKTRLLLDALESAGTLDLFARWMRARRSSARVRSQSPTATARSGCMPWSATSSVDSRGVTEAFVRNGLEVLDRELGAGFAQDDFDYVARWDAANARMDIGMQARRVIALPLPELEVTLELDPGELLRFETSTKFTRWDRARARRGGAQARRLVDGRGRRLRNGLG